MACSTTGRPDPTTFEVDEVPPQLQSYGRRCAQSSSPLIAKQPIAKQPSRLEIYDCIAKKARPFAQQDPSSSSLSRLSANQSVVLGGRAGAAFIIDPDAAALRDVLLHGPHDPRRDPSGKGRGRRRIRTRQRESG